MAAIDKPHLVCIPFPAQSHIGAMMKLAKLLHSRGFFITFVHTEYNRNRLLNARGPNSLDGLPDFKFQTIPDGLPHSDANTTQHGPSLCDSLRKNALGPFVNLLTILNSDNGIPPVTCIISDVFMQFTITTREQLNVPVFVYVTVSAGCFMGFYHYRKLVEKGLTPLKDESYLSNGYLETTIDWIPGMKDFRLKDLPSFVQITDPNDVLFNYCMEAAERAPKASAVIFHTFEALERGVLDHISLVLPLMYSIGPIQLLVNKITDDEEDETKSIGSNMWVEESKCLQWLDTKKPGFVVYVNFGSVVVISQEVLVEIGWGLANSGYNFLWIMRPDLVVGGTSALQPEFETETRERGFIGNWCPQEQVLNHPSLGCFFTHCGWNSILESLSAGVPMICLPYFADQQTNCRFVCKEWQVGVEVVGVKREQVEKLVRELMGSEKGTRLKNKAMEWKKLAEDATRYPDGSSSLDFDKIVKRLISKDEPWCTG